MTLLSIRKLLLFLSILSVNQLLGQCPPPLQTDANSGTGTAINATTVIGQSFTACEDGLLNKITVRVNFIGSTSINTELRVSQGNNTNSNRLHTQEITITGMGDVEIVLDKTVALAAGQIYAFSLGGAGDAFNISFSSSLGDTYGGGTLFRNSSILNSADLFFKLSTLPSASTIAVDLGQINEDPTIPTISSGATLANQIITALGLATTGGPYTFSTSPAAGTAITGPVTVTVKDSGGVIVGMVVLNFAFNVQPIPTMSEWGLLIFGLLVLNMAIFFIRRKERISLLSISKNR